MHFLEEFEALRRRIPRLGTTTTRAINSEYTAGVDRSTDSYFIFDSIGAERSLYGENIYECVECVDSARMSFSTRCYECLDCFKSQDCEFVERARHSRNLRYCFDMENCTNCVGCVGLRDKDFHIFNKPYTAADYFIKLRALSPRHIQENFTRLLAQTPRNGSMNYTYESHKTFWGFDVVRAENCAYLYDAHEVKDSVDCTAVSSAEGCYELTDSHDVKNCIHSFMCASAHDLAYCEYVFDSSFCFGCVGLAGKQYYILNKPYSRDEYFKKTAEIRKTLKTRAPLAI